MRKFAFVLAFAFAANIAAATAQQRAPHPATTISSPTQFEQQQFDVLHYDAWIDLTKAPARTMRGVCEIHLRWTGDPAAGPFYFHLRSLTIDSSYYNGTPVMVAPAGDSTSATYHYSLVPPASAHQGDTAIVRIVYHGEMTDELGAGYWGGVTSSGGTLFALGVGFLNNYVSATEHWLPCYDHPSDKATFHGWFTVKQGLTVASNGHLVSATPGPDSTITFEWQHDIQCATYLLTFAVDNYVPLAIQSGPLPMVVYARPADTLATHASFRLLPRMVAAFERHYGSYPFEKVGYVNTPLGAMEHQTMISFPTSLSQSGDTINTTGAHELSHQWFGDLVSPQDFRHAWLNESFAVFCESVWLEELRGYAGYLASQTGKIDRYINTVAPQEGVFPLYDFPRTPPSSNYPQTIYQKGAVVVGMLRFELGDSLFFQGLRDYLTAHAYGTATTEDLRAALEARSGRSLDTFFTQWVYGRGWPVVRVNATKTSAGAGIYRVTLDLSQTQADSLPTFTNLPLEFGFQTTGGQWAYRLVRMNGRTQRIVLDSVPEFTKMNLNSGPSVRVLLRSNITVAGVEQHSGMLPDSNNIEFVVHPNPLSSTNAFTVEVHNAPNCDGIDYWLYDSAGRRLLVGHTDACEFPIPISGFNSGVYVIRFRFHELFYDVPVMIAR